MLSVPIQKVEAVAVETAIMIEAVCSILLSFGVKYATDADWRQGANNFILQAGEATINSIKQSIDIAIGTAGYVAEGFKMMFDAETWKIISGNVSKFVQNAYSDCSSSIAPGSDGTLGFTENSQFSAKLNGGFSQLTLTDNCVLTFYSPDLRQNTLALLPHTNPNLLDESNTSIYARLFVFSCSPFSFHSYNSEIPCNQKNQYSGILSSRAESRYKVNGRFDFNLQSDLGFGDSSCLFLRVSEYSNKDTSMYRINNQVCYFTQCTDNKYRFVSIDDFTSSKSSATDETCIPLVNFITNDTYYSFDCQQDMYYTVLDACGLKHYTDSQKNESEVDVYKSPAFPLTDGTIPDVYTGSQSVGITVPDDLVKSNDMTTLNEMEATDVIEYTDITTVEFPDGVPKIDSSGLFDKFPFCIPKDLYNLFVGFSADSAPPKFDIPFRYMKQDDGSYLIDYTITIDFEQLSDIAYISRWFIGIEFVLGLILITRKVIGAQ